MGVVYVKLESLARPCSSSESGVMVMSEGRIVLDYDARTAVAEYTVSLSGLPVATVAAPAAELRAEKLKEAIDSARSQAVGMMQELHRALCRILELPDPLHGRIEVSGQFLKYDVLYRNARIGDVLLVSRTIEPAKVGVEGLLSTIDGDVKEAPEKAKWLEDAISVAASL